MTVEAIMATFDGRAVTRPKRALPKVTLNKLRRSKNGAIIQHFYPNTYGTQPPPISITAAVTDAMNSESQRSSKPP